MSKIKDKLIEQQLLTTKEQIFECDNKGYKYTDEGKAHLHSFDGKPLLGTSTVVNVLAKNLTWWASELSAVECLERGEHIPTIREEYLEAKKKGKVGIDTLQKKYPIFKDARFAHFRDMNSKAKKGTDMHSTLENYVNKCLRLNEGKPLPDKTEDKKLENFINWSILNVKRFMYSEKYIYSTKLWVGGIFDLMFEHNDGKICIGDFKSSREAFDGHFIQISGYDLQQSENGIFTAEGVKIAEPQKVEAYYVFPFGSEKFEVGVRFNVEELREGFRNCVNLYKLTNY